MELRRKLTAIMASGLLVLGAAACNGEVESPAGGDLDPGTEGVDNGVQPDGEGPETYDDPVFGDDEGAADEGAVDDGPVDG
jgi:hypothetical protein